MRNVLTRRPGLIGSLVVFSIAAAIAFLLFQERRAANDLLEWDEGYHAIWAMRIAADLSAGDITAFLYDSYRQVYWPPLFSWYLGAFILLVGPSTEAAILAGLLWFIAFAEALYLSGRLMAANGSTGAAIAGGCAAAGLGMFAGGVVTSAPQVMLELPALFWLTLGLGLYAYMWRTASAGARAYAAMGLVTVLTFLTKQNYGVLLGIAVGAGFLIDGEWWSRRPSSEVWRRRQLQAVAAVVLAIPLLIWFAYPQKIAHTIASLRNIPSGDVGSPADAFWFYPRMLPSLAGTWPMLFVWIGILLLTLVRGDWKDGRLRVLIMLIGVQAFAAQASWTKVDRHILPLVPALALLGGYWASRLRIRPLALGSLSVAALLALVGQAAALLAPAARSDGGAERLLVNLLRTEAGRDGASLIVGSIDSPGSPAALDWELLLSGRMTADGGGALRSASEERFVAGTLGRRLPRTVREVLRRVARRWPGQSGTATMYVGLPLGVPDLELRGANLRKSLEQALGRRRFERVVLALPQRSPRFPEVTPTLASSQLEALGYRPEGLAREVGSVAVRVFAR